MKRDKLLFTLFGLFFILIALLSWINALMNLDSANPLWFCYIAVFFIGLGILKRNSSMILTQINFVAIPLFFWSFDFFYNLIVGRSLWGISDYFFIVGWMNSLGNFLTLQHIYTIPIALGFVYLLGIRRDDLWKFSFGEAMAIFVASLLFSPLAANANCVFRTCVNFVPFTTPGYQIFWIFIVFIMILATNFILVHAAKKLHRYNARVNK